MTSARDNGCAFPTQMREYDGQGNVLQYQIPGMTLRQWYAGMILQGILSAGRISGSPQYISRWAFDYADAMIKIGEQ